MLTNNDAEVFCGTVSTGPFDADAAYRCGLHYGQGDAGTTDLRLAFSWTRQAAQAGHVKAQSSLGNYYAKGHGVRKDPQQAVDWYRRAADAGDADAQ